VSIVIPVYNEEGILATSIGELREKLKGFPWSYEILISENGSRDRTVALAEDIARDAPEVQVHSLGEPNYGKALKQGILRARGKFVICDEIDLCDVEFYQRALPLLASGADLVVGSKAMKGANDARPLVRRLATRVITLLLRFATGFSGTDTHGLKAFKRDRLVDVARACVVERDLFASEFVIRAQRMGRDVREIPIALQEKRPPSTHLLRRVPRVLKGLIKLGWAIRIRHRS